MPLMINSESYKVPWLHLKLNYSRTHRHTEQHLLPEFLLLQDTIQDSSQVTVEWYWISNRQLEVVVVATCFLPLLCGGARSQLVS